MNAGAPPDLRRGTAPRGGRGLARIAVRVTGAMLAAVLLAGVFMLYLQPEFLRALADQVWACF
ncbi:hypothetical protein [Xylophilus ampelinus]|uniref:Uncharacterized protein n=1 Tax=Xylophilus ampelinus TaxID=54067 RepID=A0A318T288_9BURK|nr:hypothetical protein [Xylophilus ampelinus]MCS4509253.1 hypothetical protein [Xylophilus ampelinus]PYE79721.1 hypothetical protein DFQ15_10140 [Xylophilus ampelinus]